MKFYEISVASDLPHMYSYILRPYFPTSHISKLSSSFISYAGLGIYSTISSYAGGAVYFRIAKFWERVFKRKMRLH